jgi:L-asparaginase / beta-aspartyl-peptidase
MLSRIVVAIVVLASLACVDKPTEMKRMDYAIAIHGGAGTVPRTMEPEKIAAYETSLKRALELGRDRLAGGSQALDVVEEVVRLLEDDPLFNAGKGAVFTHDGTHELDASIMDGRTLACGAVAGVKNAKNPISLARLVMTKTRHVLLVGDGADAFAREMKVDLVDNAWFDTDRRREQWQELVTKEREAAERGDKAPLDAGTKGTVGVVALDKQGHLAAATSTGGMTNKRWGRAGDSPIIGAGTYANDATVAVSCTGTGEEFIRHAVARTVHARMELAKEPLDVAARASLAQLKKGDGGLIAVDKHGNIALPYNTEGMYRGAADSKGRFDVAIWER